MSIEDDIAYAIERAEAVEQAMSGISVYDDKELYVIENGVGIMVAKHDGKRWVSINPRYNVFEIEDGWPVVEQVDRSV
jgi:hypothetical protein